MSKILDLSQPVMVTTEAFDHFKAENLVSDDGNTFECTLINCNVIGRNPTFYPLTDILQSMDERSVKERLEQKCFYGEAEHPISDTEAPLTLKRLMRVEPSRISHRIDSFRVVGDDIKGIVSWSGPFGEDYKEKLTVQGSNLAMSIRAYTPNFIKKTDPTRGAYAVKKHLMHIASFDCVMMPGLGGARIMDPEKFKEISRTNKTIVRSTETAAEYQFNDPISEIRNMSRSSEGMKFISDVYGADYDNDAMKIVGTNMLQMQTTEGANLILPLDNTLLSNILG